MPSIGLSIKTLGELTGCETGAAQLVAKPRARIAALRKAMAGLPKPRVLVLEWTDPPMGPGHWTPGLVEDAGGKSWTEAEAATQLAAAHKCLEGTPMPDDVRAEFAGIAEFITARQW